MLQIAEKKIHVCKRCGLCCAECGDMYSGTEDTLHCPWLEFEGGLAVCTIERDCGRAEKPEVCRGYPFEDIDGGKCRREIVEEKERQNNVAVV